MTDEMAVKMAVSDLSDAQGSPEKFRAVFVEGAAPDEAQRARFQDFMTTATGVTVAESGDRATAQVQFEVLETGELKGPFEWTLEKVGDRWLIRTAVLP